LLLITPVPFDFPGPKAKNPNIQSGDIAKTPISIPQIGITKISHHFISR